MLVLGEERRVRIAWNIVLAVILSYTGTVFPFRLVFLEFRIPTESPSNAVFLWIEEPINILFWVDLVMGFFLSYRDRDGKEVCSIRRIVLHYLSGYFWLNLLACAPDIDFTWIGDAIDTGHDHEDNASLQRLMRLTRFRRIPRMLRLGRSLARLARVMLFYGRAGIWYSLTHSRKVRVIRLLVCCTWVMHIFACGWYLVASLHFDPYDTWVGRRGIIDLSPVEQWVTAFYFVTTVFTTVGFGDMSAASSGEMLFCCLIMVAGIIVNGILIGEVIHTVMVDSEDTACINKHLVLISQLSTHAELDDELMCELREWVKVTKVSRFDDDIESLTRLLTSAALPMGLMERLPEAVYHGQLWKNRFLTCTEGLGWGPPPRLAVLVALLGYRRTYRRGDFVYRQGDLACNIFLVLEGTFAEVGPPWSAAMAMLMSENDHSRRAMQALQAVTAITGTRIKPVKTETSSESSHLLYPYRIWAGRNYFGEVELFKPMSRQADVRCESEAGSLLVVDKPRFLSLLEEFADLAAVWRSAAEQRRHRRAELLRRLHEPMDIENLAAAMIQRWVRVLCAKRPPGRGRRPFPVHPASRLPVLPVARRTSDPHRTHRWGDALLCKVGIDARLQHVEESLLRIEAALGANAPAVASKTVGPSGPAASMKL